MPISSRADQMIGIVELEGEAEHGRDRSERDVALVPVEPDAEDLAALERAAADDAGIDHRGGVRAGLRAGQAEARNFRAVGKPRQPVILLRLGAELQQQLAGAERIRHHRGHRGRDRTGRELADDLRMRVGGKSEAAVWLRNDHREELVRLEKVPDLRRQVAQIPGDLPIVEHAAELLDRAVEKRLLLGRKLGGRVGQQLCPVGIAGEQIGVPPDVAGLDRLALGVRQAGQHTLGPSENVTRNIVSSKRHGPPAIQSDATKGSGRKGSGALYNTRWRQINCWPMRVTSGLLHTESGLALRKMTNSRKDDKDLICIADRGNR